MIIKSVNPNNKSAFALKELLKDHKSNIYLNWGERYTGSSAINWGCAVARAVDKVATFKVMHRIGVPIPNWTQSQTVAMLWQEKGDVVLARDNGKSRSEGMVRVEPGDDMPKKDFYTKFIPDITDVRIHVFDNEVLGAQLMVNDKWVLSPLPVAFDKQMQIHDIAKTAVAGMRLDFGAVDMGITPEGRVVVFEINTAPSIGAIMASRYAQAVKKLAASM